MVEAIRDQWAIVLAVVVLLGVLAGLWLERANHRPSAHGRSRK
jgi:hypothetical protein